MKTSLQRYATGLGITVFAVVVAAEIGGLRYYQTASRRADLRLDRAERELNRVRQQRPAPTQASAQALAMDIEETQRTLVVMENAFTSATRNPVGTAPNRPADLFFASGALIESVGTRAREANIGLAREAATLGFSAYTREGPESARGAAVRRQLEIARRFLDTLLASRPQTLLAVQRELPLTDSEQQARHSPPKRGDRASPAVSKASPRDSTDYFVIDPRWSVFSAGVVDTVAFRLVFAGDTEVLRAFLGAVSAGNSDLIRSIEVEPISVSATDLVKPAPGDPSASIVLRENVPTLRPAVPAVSRTSKFTVVVEHVEIVPPVRSDAGRPST